MFWARCNTLAKCPQRPDFSPAQRGRQDKPFRWQDSASQNLGYLEFPVAMAGSNENEYVCRRQGASGILLIRQQIIESFDLHHRHNHAEALLVMREIVHHRFVRNEPSGHGHGNIDRLASRQLLFQFAPQRR